MSHFSDLHASAHGADVNPNAGTADDAPCDDALSWRDGEKIIVESQIFDLLKAKGWTTEEIAVFAKIGLI